MAMFVVRYLESPTGVVAPQEWERMLAHLRPGGTWRCYASAGFGIGEYTPPQRGGTYVVERGERLCVTTGHPNKPGSRANDHATLLAEWRQAVDAVLPPDAQAWEGLFSVAAYHAPSRAFAAMTDRLGMWPIYVSRDDDGWWVASSALAIGCLRPVTFDPDALACIRTAGYLLADVSLFREIRRLDAGTILTFTGRTEERQRWWKPPAPKADGSASEEARAFVDAATANLRDRLDVQSHTLCTLTAGLDSRCIIALLLATKLPATFFTSNTEDPIDVSVARLLAETLGLKWSEYSPARLEPASLRNVMLLSTMLCDGESQPARGTTFWSYGLRERVEPTVWGFGGEVWRDYWSKQEKGRFLLKGATPLDRLVRYRMTGSPIPLATLAPEFRSDTHRRAVELLTPEYDALSDRDVLDRLEVLYLTQRVRRWASTHLVTMAWWTWPELPFLGQRLIEQAYALPSAARTGGEIMRHTVWEHCRVGARLPHNEGYYTMPRARATLADRITTARLDARHLLRKLHLFKRQPVERAAQKPNPSYRDAFSDLLTTRDMTSAFLYDPAALEEHITAHWEEPTGASRLLNGVLGLEQALRSARALQT